MDIQELAQRAAQKGKTLTQPRKTVFLALKQNVQAITAYELVDIIGDGIKPMTVYRALDFLTEIGAAHRIESLNAYMICRESHCAHVNSKFMICTKCGDVDEIHNHALEHSIKDLLTSKGFTAKTMSLEVSGICNKCHN